MPGSGIFSSSSAAAAAVPSPSVPWGSNQFGVTARRTDTTLQTIIQSAKLIKVKFEATDDIVKYVDGQSNLSGAIKEYFGRETNQLKIQIAIFHLGEELKKDAQFVYDNMKTLAQFDLDQFFEGLFEMNFPSPNSSLQLGYSKLTQNFPTKRTIVEYARTFRCFVNMLKWDLNTQINKFLEGLTCSDVKSALRRHKLGGMAFNDMVSLAVDINNNLNLEKNVSRALVLGEDGGTEEELGHVYKIFETPFSHYKDKARKHGLGDGCWNCFSGNHRSITCQKRSCKFCDRPTNVVKHYSLLCPKAPKNFDNFIIQRNKAELMRTANVKVAEDIVEWQFDDTDFD